MDYKEIIKAVKKRELSTVYFLHGEESYFIDKISETIENEILTEAEKSFNQTVLYGKDVKDVNQIIDVAMRFPMMSERQVIVIKEAQDLEFLKRGGENDSLKRLQNYIEHAPKSTVLCFAHKHKKLDGRSAFAKSLVKNSVMFESKPLYDNQLPDFIRGILHDAKLDIAPEAMIVLIEYLGADISKLVNEIEKLRINLNAGGIKRIETTHIEKYIGISREYNIFELQNALGVKNAGQAFKIIHYFSENPKDAPLVMLISSLYGYFSKLYQLSGLNNAPLEEKLKALGLRTEWFLKDYNKALQFYNQRRLENVISILKEYDLKSKGINVAGVDEKAFMEEMVYKILHV